MTYLNEARELLAKGRLEESILFLKKHVQDPDMLHRVVSLESRFNVLEDKIQKGIIEDEDVTLEQNRITNNVLVLISNLANPEEDQRLRGQSNTGSGGSRFDFKWVVIGILVLVILLGGGYLLSLGQRSESPAPTAELPREEFPATEETTTAEPPTNRGTSTPAAPPTRPNETTSTGTTSARPAPPADPTPTTDPAPTTSTPEPNRTEPDPTPADPCATLSCLNGGRCVNGKCDCPPGYSGDRCQTRDRLSGEDCLRFTADALRVLEEGGQFILSDGRRRMITFPNRAEADRTLALIRHYQLRGSCFAQRPNPALQYFVTSNFELPRGSFSGEDCMRIRNPQGLKARSYNENSWILADGSSVLFRTKSKAETEMIQRAMRHYDPGYICYIGRPEPSVIYLRN